MFNKFTLAVATIGFAAIGFATSASAAVNIVVNPSFEMGSGVDTAKGNLDTSITGWTTYTRLGLPSTGAYYASTASWDASDGQRSVELNGAMQGGIYQDVILQVGKQYKFSFDYSVDPSGSRLNNPFTASVRSFNNGISYVRPVGHSATNMLYNTFEIVFTATNAANRVSFNSGNAGQFGVVIDAVNLALVPEPATWAMLIAGFGMVGFSMRRRRTALDSVSN